MVPKTLIGILPTLLLSFPLAAQEVIIYQVEYICETKIQTRHYDGLNTLYISGDKSLYVHDEFPKVSGFTGVVRGSPDKRRVGYIKGDSEGLPVYLDFSKDTMIYKTDYFILSRDNFILSSKIPKINWAIHTLERDIGSYRTRLAVGDFGGRTYDVWFTEEIPLPFGPYMLNGLPGLILEAFSRDEMVSYRFKSFKKNEDAGIEVTPPSDGMILSMEKLTDILITDLYRAESLGATHNDPLPNREIIKNKWTIFGDYKKKREERQK
ncbi:MAG: GLPGLI family protein [Saprospirales bacterium]|nr:MAG: GLPGLI family protein [Saprospirales bacterium]